MTFNRRLGFECRKILSHRTLLPLLLSPIEFIRRLAVITARVRLHDARVHGKPLALDEAHPHRSHDDALENMAQNVALTEPVQPVLENVAWWGIASLRSSRQNHLYARWSFISSHSFLSERMPKQ